jgi:hypothetical protein
VNTCRSGHVISVTVSKLRIGGAIAQAVSRLLPTAAARVQTRVWSCGILWWTKVALGQVFSENFGFPCHSGIPSASSQSSSLSPEAGTISQVWMERMWNLAFVFLLKVLSWPFLRWSEVKVKISPLRALETPRIREVEAPTLLRQTANRWRQGCQSCGPAAVYPQVSFLKFLVLISVRIWVDPGAIVQLEGLGQLGKNPPHRDAFPRPSGL